MEKAIVKNLKTIKNPKAIREDRVAAIDFFSDLEDPEKSVPALLQRFDYSLEHGINDSREKESAMKGIVGFEKASVPFIIEHIRSSDRVAWPIKALKQLAGEEEVITALESCLDYGDVAFDQSKVDKNYDILCYLRDYKLSDEFSRKLFHFLTVHDERVRFAVVEALLEQQEPGIPEKLEAFLRDDSAENTRIRQAVTIGFVNGKWQVSNPSEFPEGSLIAGARLTKDSRLELMRQ